MLYASLCNVRFNPLVDISDIVSCLTLITVAISGIFAIYKWNKNLKLKRAEYILARTREISETNEQVTIKVNELEEKIQNLFLPFQHFKQFLYVILYDFLVV